MREEKLHFGSFIALFALYMALNYIDPLAYDSLYLYPSSREQYTSPCIAALGLSEGHVFTLPYLEWPDGAQVRYIAWPVLILSAITFLLRPDSNLMNLGVFFWLLIQGIGGYLIGRKKLHFPYTVLFCVV